jgi:hypothetical protein
MRDKNLKGKNQTAPKDEITTKRFFSHGFLRGLVIRYSIQSTLVILLLLMAVVVTLNDTKKCNTREKAFEQIVAAEKADDFTGIIQEAEIFFSVKPLTGKDEREPYVKELYDKAIVRLFTEQTEQPDANALDHFKRYRHLIVDKGK